MISEELSATLRLATDEAMKRRHEYASVEHLLFVILRDRTGAEIIESCGGSIERLNTALEAFFSEEMETVPKGNEYTIQPTPSF